MLWWLDKSQSSNWVSGTDGRTVFDHKGCWKNDDSWVISQRFDPIELINGVSESKNDKEWD